MFTSVIQKKKFDCEFMKNELKFHFWSCNRLVSYFSVWMFRLIEFLYPAPRSKEEWNAAMTLNPRIKISFSLFLLKPDWIIKRLRLSLSSLLFLCLIKVKKVSESWLCRFNNFFFCKNGEREKTRTIDVAFWNFPLDFAGTQEENSLSRWAWFTLCYRTW